MLAAAAILLLSSAGPVKPPESEQYRQAALRDSNFRPTEKISFYRTYNFAPLLLFRYPGYDAVKGFIGPNCQRLQLRLVAVRQDTANPARYYLTGKAKVLGNLSTFSGTLVLRQVRELRQLNRRTDETISPARREGIALADYELREDPQQAQTGVFKGVMLMKWYVDKTGRLRYDDISGIDDFRNNQFVGTWTSYATHQTLRCNWGDYRIPNSGDFDIGAGEFSPADKYLAFGWQDVRDCTFGGKSEALSAAACKREKQVWWK